MRSISGPSLRDPDLIDAGWGSGIGIFKCSPDRTSYINLQGPFSNENIGLLFKFKSVEMATAER